MEASLLPLGVMLAFGGHALADYGLQSAWLADHKVRGPKNPDWAITLSAHCLMHGLATTIAIAALLLIGGVETGRAFVLASMLGWAETVLHFAIDHAKGQERFSYRTDQLLHYGAKLLWISIALQAA